MELADKASPSIRIWELGMRTDVANCLRVVADQQIALTPLLGCFFPGVGCRTWTKARQTKTAGSWRGEIGTYHRLTPWRGTWNLEASKAERKGGEDTWC